MNTRFAAAAILAAGAFGATQALAQTATDTFDVTVTIADACSVAATDLNFVTYLPGDVADTPGATNIDVTCTLGTIYDIAFSAGASGNFADRTMIGAANSEALSYQLCDALDVLCLTPLGDGVGGTTALISGVGVGLVPFVHAITGKIIAGQDVSADTYTDTITATLTY